MTQVFGRSRRVATVWMLLILALVSATATPASALPPLRVSGTDRHYLAQDDGSANGVPLFLLVDTGWSLPKVSSANVTTYMQDRAAKGFNAVLVDILLYYNFQPIGPEPFVDGNLSAPNETYWTKVDNIVTTADTNGLYVILTPIWSHTIPTFLNDSTTLATTYGTFLGNRYKTYKNVIWMVSGEYMYVNNPPVPISSSQKAVFDALANAISTAGATQLKSIHGINSANDFHTTSWLSFNSIESGHVADNTAFGRPENYTYVENDFALSPIKPVYTAEDIYEGVQIDWTLNIYSTAPPADAAVIRRKAYWAALAGAFGATYGEVCVSVNYEPTDVPQITYPWNCSVSWTTHLNSTGALQFKHLKTLINTQPITGRIPAQNMIVSGLGSGPTHVQATRGSNGKYAWVYIPSGGSVTIDLAQVNFGVSVDASWYNPRTGAQGSSIGVFPASGTQAFTPPDSNDWVLVLNAMTADTTPPTPPTGLRVQ